MAIEETTNMSTGAASTSWGVIIFFLILFWIFTGGVWGGNRNGNDNDLAMLAAMKSGQVTNCELERRSLLNTDAITAAVQNSTNELSPSRKFARGDKMGQFIFGLLAGFLTFSTDGEKIRKTIAGNLKRTIAGGENDENRHAGLDASKNISASSRQAD